MNFFKLLTALYLTFFVPTSAWTSEDVDLAAASNAVMCLETFYFTMAELPKVNTKKNACPDNKKNAIFIKKNREMLIKEIAGANAGYDISRANRIIQNIRQKNTTDFEYRSNSTRATGKAYYDTSTKHKYIKLNDKTYLEYTRKGCFFKIASSSQPHLAKSPYIRPINKDNFFLYVKQSVEKKQYLTLPCNIPHPAGWCLEKIFVALN